MSDQETIYIATKFFDESLELFLASLTDAWPTAQKPTFVKKGHTNVNAVLVVVHSEDDLCALFPIITDTLSQKLPMIVATGCFGALQNLLCDLDLVKIDINSTPETIAGLLCGIMQNSVQCSQLRSQVNLMRGLQKSLKDDLCFLQDELQTAATIQQEYMSYETPQIEGISFDTIWKPAGVVSGDMYDITKLDDSHVSFFISDSIGHGISAAMLAMMLNRTLSVHRFHSVTGGITQPSEMMKQLNNALLLRTGTSARFATAVYGILNTNTHCLTFAGAGHPPALVSHHSGKATLLESEGPLLGVFDAPTFQEQDIQLRLGDTVLLYSDGFENLDPISSEPCSELPRHLQAMHEVCITSRDEVAESIVSKTRTKHPVHHDDLTLIAIKVDGETPIQLAA